ncbi:MAG: FAD-dependent oxidoreductase [Clostridiales Family XIII bacterium]|jgi:2,4-dienoyl-CoA reductase-like NADH-dependent reductase (Old Yellow Enzyme family)/thioredoxin reductase|nr:FAD-dependent oxidoreductase [Clostridiales Family XIII bacterium]
MSILKYPRLFEPVQLGGQVFKNRIFASPEGYYTVGKDNLPNADESAFFERKALGGFASVCVGDCIVDSKTGVHYPYLIRMDDPSTLPGLSTLARSVSRHGAVAAAELSHSGMYARFIKDPDADSYGPDANKEAAERKASAKGGTLYGPVYMADSKYGEVEAMSEELILHIVEKYAYAAAWAKRCGFGMVTVHGGHGWLLAQFMSPVLNTRKDRWGGTFENRMRFPLAVIDGIRKAVGRKYPIEIRFSGSECDPAGYDIGEGVKIAQALDEKVDLLHVSAGNHEFEHTFIITHPSMFLPDGSNVQYAAEIKKHVKTPVACVGGLTDPAQMEEIIASGQADIVQLGRQTLADPDLPVKARAGRNREINKCMRCCMCFSGAGNYRRLQCATNPIIGNELEEKFAIPAWDKKKVLVVGGGVAGMQAALTAAGQGHEVILAEKGSRLGGVLRCEEKVSFKQKLDAYLNRQARFVTENPNIELRLSTEITPEAALEIAPDVIIAALGSRPVKPPIPGIDSANVIGAEDLYYNPEKAGKDIVILGGGLVGIELGIFRASDDHNVTIVEMMPEFNLDPFGMHTLAVTAEIDRLSIKTHLSTAVQEITKDGVTVKGPDGKVFDIKADTVVYATGQAPQVAQAFALSGTAPEFYQVGDCVAPRNIVFATREAYTAAKDIGRKI